MSWRMMNIAAVLVVASANGVAAQEAGRVALDLGYPPSFALLWKVTDGLALRPDATFQHVSGDNIQSTWRFGLGASALLTANRSGALTTYFGARGGYQWYALPHALRDLSGAGMFGARFALDLRLGISAETGISYDRLSVSPAPGSPFPGRHETILQPTGRVSALLYF